MNDNINKTVNEILESYSKHEQTCRLSEDNIINKSVLIQVLEEIRKLLFPGYFDKNRVREEYIGYIVGDRIEFIQYNLKKQIAKALKGCEKCNDLSYDEVMEKSEKLVYEFLSKIPSIRDYLATDVVAAFNGDPAAYSTDEIILCYPGFFAITVYRVAHELWKLKIPMIPRVLSEYAHGLTGIDIHPGATIGKYFRPVSPSTTTRPPVMYSQQWSPTPSTTAFTPELRTAKRSPTRPLIYTSPSVAPYSRVFPAMVFFSASKLLRTGGSTAMRPPLSPFPR